MEAKEKAEELVIKMYQLLPASKEAEKGKEHLYYNQFNAAKQCAIIAVEEIIKARPLNPNCVDCYVCGGSFREYYAAQIDEADIFWLQVKHEIQNI